MNRRITVALVAAAAFTVGLAPVATAAIKKNEIRIVGGAKFVAGKYVKDDVRFKPLVKSVNSGATIKVVDKGDPAPHTISFVKKRFMPKSFEFAAFAPLLAAHQANPETEEVGFFQVNDGVGVPNDQAGVLEVNSLGDNTSAGDSQFFPPRTGTTFKVTASKGTTLPYYCALHPWMQGKLKVK
jgi:plastocyanin